MVLLWRLIEWTTIIIADLAGAKRDANYTKKELSIEQHQKNVLQSKVNTLEGQVVHQKREMKELKGDAKEKLTSAGDHVRQTRHEVANLKAKVRIHDCTNMAAR